LPIEVSEAKEDLNIPIELRLRPFLNSFYVGKFIIILLGIIIRPKNLTFYKGT